MSQAIVLENLTKAYARFSVRRQFVTLKTALLRGSILRDLRPDSVFTALHDISFKIEQGTTTAIIGPNGSGKSTLLKILAGVTKPSSGFIKVNGRVAALLELGTGFHPEVSGRENIIISGMMLGLTKREIEKLVPEIIDFAGIPDFMEAPVKTYSSGMYARLAFAVAFAVDPDILLVDEILAVGDEGFGFKCLGRFMDFKRRGKTILFVTHGLMLAESLADVAILLEKGEMTGIGEPHEMVDRYRGHVFGRESTELAEASTSAAAAAEPAHPEQPGDEHGIVPHRWGSREVEITNITLKSADGLADGPFQTGDAMLLDVEMATTGLQSDLVLGFAVRTRDNRLVYETSTNVERLNPLQLNGRGHAQITFPSMPLVEGTYLLDVGLHTRIGVALDYHQACRMFAIRNKFTELGTARLDHSWRFAKGLSESEPPAGSKSNKKR